MCAKTLLLSILAAIAIIIFAINDTEYPVWIASLAVGCCFVQPRDRKIANQRGYSRFEAMIVISSIVGLILSVVCIYAMIHFIAKFW